MPDEQSMQSMHSMEPAHSTEARRSMNGHEEVRPMSALNKLMSRGIISPFIHGLLDYPLAAVLIVLPLVLDFNDDPAKWIAFALGIGAAVLAVGTAWQTGIVRVIPPLLHGYTDIAVTVALIVLPFIVGFTSHTTALVFYLVVGAGGLLATLATRFPSRMPAEHHIMTPREAA